MNISLTPDLDEFVRAQVDGGQYRSSSEVVRDALRLFRDRLAEREAKLAWLRHEVQRGLDSGPATEMNFSVLWREAREEFERRAS